MITDLPVELVHKIVRSAAPTTMATIRLCNKTLRNLASPLLFRTFHLTFSRNTGEALGCLADSTTLAKFVREIVLADDEMEDHLALEDIGILFEDLGSKMHKFTNLINLCITFTSLYESPPIGPTGSGQEAFQRRVLSFIDATKPLPSLQALTIKNLCPFDSPYSSFCREFSQGRPDHFSSLTSLSITVLSADGPEIVDDEAFGFIFFWEAIFQKLVLPAPAHSNLTSLTLRSDQLIGYLPNISFPVATAYPQLESITLQMFVFGGLTNAEHFILVHSATLKRLELQACSIVFEDGDSDDEELEPERFWSDIFAKLAEECTELVEVVMKRGESISEGTQDIPGGRFGYSVFSEYNGYRTVERMMDGEEGDEEALDTLLAVVADRQ
ncbi:hypothetical protein JAAARDRAFT_37648 [Jaapia argillacea MUCL 33604]|uniref:F-box domain-containing protein n=1 Tax=Jaapia argillacea MUCL 33604 TaxID=933084 RepID=A0A067PV25_9AGAM|nr:hypothetical protein JAAARDRAFT_37648 [Jaapia argillacea MUCL 33604]